MIEDLGLGPAWQFILTWIDLIRWIPYPVGVVCMLVTVGRINRAIPFWHNLILSLLWPVSVLLWLLVAVLKFIYNVGAVKDA